jgi:hypothetical protein
MILDVQSRRAPILEHVADEDRSTATRRHDRRRLAVRLFRRNIGENVTVATRDSLDGPAVVNCQHKGCRRTIKTTLGALRKGVALECSAGHTTVIDGRKLDRDVRRFEREGKRRRFN